MAYARKFNEAFSWNEGFKEYYAIKAAPNPFLMKLLRKEGLGIDCSSMAELVLAERVGPARRRDHVHLQRYPG